MVLREGYGTHDDERSEEAVDRYLLSLIYPSLRSSSLRSPFVLAPEIEWRRKRERGQE